MKPPTQSQALAMRLLSDACWAHRYATELWSIAVMAPGLGDAPEIGSTHLYVEALRLANEANSVLARGKR